MADEAYIGLTADGEWALYQDAPDADAPVLLAVGAAFEPGAGIRDAVDALAEWAAAAGYYLVTPRYTPASVQIDGEVDAALFDAFFGPADATS